MDFATTSVVPVITLWEEFMRREKNVDIQQFARWIIRENGNTAKQQASKAITAGRKVDIQLGEIEKVLLYLYRLNRLVEMKGKPLIKKIGFAKTHEYAMLAEICLLKNPNKKEVAEKMLLENSTAVEITNRLVQRGLIKETVDPNDKRSTRLSVTDKGMKKLYESYEIVRLLQSGFLDCLDAEERKELVRILELLDTYHSLKLNG